jgi:hypothetical protein
MERIEVKGPDLFQTDNLGIGTHLDGFTVYQELPRIFSVLRVDSTSPRSTYG